MQNKKVLFGDEARAKIKIGIDMVVDAVKVTLGPRGRNVAQAREFGAPGVSNDGANAAKGMKSKDPFIQMGIEWAREVARKTELLAGDGTTTTLILFQAIIDEGLKVLSTTTNVMQMRRGIERAVEEVCDRLKNMAEKVNTYEDVFNVANISIEDPNLAHTIAEVLMDIGAKGVVIVQESEKTGIFVEKASGYTINKGFASPYIINNYSKLQGEYNNVPVFITDKKVMFSEKLIPLLEKLAGEGENTVMIIADDIDGEALQTFQLNKARNIMNIIPVRFSTFGEDKRDELEDIAIRCGTEIIGERSEIQVEDLDPALLGRVEKVIIKKDTTTLINASGNIEDRVRELQELLKTTDQVAYIESRIANLQGNTAVIKVGALTDVEKKYLKDKLDDAVNATKGAMEEGIVDGGGNALRMILDRSTNPEIQVGIDIIQKAIYYPFFQLLANSNIELSLSFIGFFNGENQRYNDVVERFMGYNASSGKFTHDLMGQGVVDPVKVTINALKNAASSASLFLTTEVAIADDLEGQPQILPVVRQQ